MNFTKTKITKLIKEHGRLIFQLSLSGKRTECWLFGDKEIKNLVEELIVKLKGVHEAL